jgi:hypothetical protein
MTNDGMTNDERMTNAEARMTKQRRRGLSSFGISHSTFFVIGHSVIRHSPPAYHPTGNTSRSLRITPGKT